MLKEKLKILKQSLRGWNKDVFCEMNKNKERIMLKISKLDKRDRDFGLNEHDRIMRKQLFA